ncbi:MAG: hypothetical protein ACI9CF_001880 [Candidatus Omnitrophota bacterium]
MDPVTVQVNASGKQGTFTILEQNYEYDLISRSKLLDKYIGQQVWISNPRDFQDRVDTVEAILLSNQDGEIYQIGDKIHLGHPGHVVLPELPQNLHSKPTLIWHYQNEGESKRELEVSYLTQGMSWKSDYVLTLGASDQTGDILGWVSLNNRSGATYTNAKLKLVAGDVNRVQSQSKQRTHDRRVMMSAMSSEQFSEKEFFEYHIYDLGRQTTLKDNQTKQIQLLQAADISINKHFVATTNQPYLYNSRQNAKQKIPVKVNLIIQNSAKNNLGSPLPQGIVRVYKEDSEGSIQFVGEDSINHTPKNEELELTIGEAFDLVINRIQVDHKKLTNQLSQSTWEITLKNHKSEAALIQINEQMPINWKILESTHSYRKTNAAQLQFNINVNPEEEVVIRYQVQAGL